VFEEEFLGTRKEDQNCIGKRWEWEKEKSGMKNRFYAEADIIIYLPII